MAHQSLKDGPATIGGAPVVTLEAPPSPSTPTPDAPAFTRVWILPGRGMMSLQIEARLPGRGPTDLLASPSLAKARAVLEAPEEFPGNSSYTLGGAILLPFANRLTGEPSPDGRSIAARILGRTVRLPANHGGRRPGARRYALHGLLLAARADEVERTRTAGQDAVRGRFRAGDFGGRWLSRAEVEVAWSLTAAALALTVEVRNVGQEALPMGIGWHPYFTLPGGRRSAALLHLPARRRALVNDNDEVLPTGELEAVAGTPYDFTPESGRPLGDLALDDCFVDLQPGPDGTAAATLIDPAAAYGLRVTATLPQVRAFQVYAPTDARFVAIEPQFNLADPFGAVWGPDVDTGMERLAPGESTRYEVRLELFEPPQER
jgi:aldose 1-epimerase